MQRASLLLLLTCICAPALAQNARVSAVAQDHATCDEISDKRPAAAKPAAPTSPVTPMASIRAKPALPSAPRSRGGGGDDGDGSAVPRPRSPKWHSFLPGMFR